MPPSRITRALDEMQAKRRGIEGKIVTVVAELDELLAKPVRTEGEETRMSEITVAAERLQDALANAKKEYADAMLRGIQDGTFTTVDGGPSGPESFDRDPARDSRDVLRPRSHNPWAVLRGAPFTVNLAPAEVKARAYDAACLASGAPDSARAALVKALERWDDPQGNLARTVLVTTNPDYVSAFWALARGEKILTQAEVEAVRMVGEHSRALGLTDAAGGYLIPELLDPSVILTGAGVQSDVEQISRVEMVLHGDTWKGVASTGTAWSWDGEAAEVSDDSPTFTQPTVPLHKIQAWLPFSIELGLSTPNLTETAMAALFDDYRDKLASAFVTGTGSSQPTGVEYGVAAVTTSRVAATTNNSFGVVDVYKLWDALPARHKPNASWIANEAIYSLIRQMDTSGGSSMWVQLGAGRPGGLLGHYSGAASPMDGVIGTGNDDILLVGDFRKYLIAKRVGMSVELIPHTFGVTNGRPTGQRGFYGFAYLGAAPLDVGAFRLLRV